MPESTSQPYAELLKEFRHKVDYLKKEYHLEQQQIAANIGEHPTNFSRYMDIRRDRPCGVRKLLVMLQQLNVYYVRELLALELPDSPRDIYSELTAIQNKLTAIHHLLLEMAGRSEAG